MNAGELPSRDAGDDVVDVVCIAGTGQNGATLLSRMLGGLPGINAVGELGRLWDTGLIEDRPCSCGESFRDCPYWSRVGQVGYRGWDRVDGYTIARTREAIRLKRRIRPLPRAPVPQLRKIGGTQLLPFLLLGRCWPEYRKNLRFYTDDLGRLYHAISETSGGGLVVDSMKVPYHVFLIRHVPHVRLRVVHVVRDVRGVALSSLRTVPKQGAEGRYRGTRHPVKTGIRWSWVNLSSHLLRRLGVPTLRLRYEDIVRDPQGALAKIAAFADIDVSSKDFTFIDGAEVDLPRGHLVAGNRVRMHSGPLHLRVDEEWRTELSPKQQRMSTVFAWPLMRRYGYLVGRTEGDSGAPGSPSAIINP